MSRRFKPAGIIVGTTYKIMQNSVFLSMFLVTGSVLLVVSAVHPPLASIWPVGVSLISAAAIGIHMMLGTSQVAKGLHERFDKIEEILKDIATTQKDMAETLKEIRDRLDRS